MNPGVNVITFTGTAATLPVSPGRYLPGRGDRPEQQAAATLPARQPARADSRGRPVKRPAASRRDHHHGSAQAFPNPPDGVPIGQTVTNTTDVSRTASRLCQDRGRPVDLRPVPDSAPHAGRGAGPSSSPATRRPWNRPPDRSP